MAVPSLLARVDIDGRLDETFVPTAMVSNMVQLTSLAIQPDGKVLLGGPFATKSLVRLNPNGTLDGRFVPETDHSTVSLLVQPDSKILVAGIRDSGHIVWRLEAEQGFIDRSFSNAINLASGPVSMLYDQNRHQIYIGYSRGIRRINYQGWLDSSFVSPTFEYNSAVWALAFHTCGKILAAGAMSLTNSLGKVFHLARFNRDGWAPDPNRPFAFVGD